MKGVPLSRRAGLSALLALAALAAPGLSGCAAAPTPPPPAAVRPVPAGTTTIPAGTVPTASDTSCDPTASLRPVGPLPAPGQMPPGSTMDQIARDPKNGALVVGVDQNTIPFGYRDPATGSLAGADIELAREMSRAIFGDPDRIRFRTESLAQRVPNLMSVGGTGVDLVVQTLSATCDRRQQIEFSTPYFVAQQRLMVPKTSDVRTLADLGVGPNRPARRVCTIASTTAERSILAEPTHPIAVTVPENSDCLVLLQQEQVDAIVTDDTILSGFERQDQRVEMRGAPIGTGEPYVIGVRRDRPDLVRFLNGVLEKLRADGTLARIYAPAAVTPGSAPPPAPRYRG